MSTTAQSLQGQRTVKVSGIDWVSTRAGRRGSTREQAPGSPYRPPTTHSVRGSTRAASRHWPPACQRSTPFPQSPTCTRHVHIQNAHLPNRTSFAQANTAALSQKMSRGWRCCKPRLQPGTGLTRGTAPSKKEARAPQAPLKSRLLEQWVAPNACTHARLS